MDTIKLTIENSRNGEEPMEVECKSCICIVFDPRGYEADMIQIMQGTGDRRYLISKATESMWILADKTIDNELEKNMLGAFMLTRLKKAILGDSSFEGEELLRK